MTTPNNLQVTQSKAEPPRDLITLLEEEAHGLVEHLAELRVRLIIGLVAFIIATVIGWYCVPWVFEFFRQSVERLIYVAPTEAFFSRFKIAAAIGALLSLPVVIYQAWQFVLPALFPNEEKIVRAMVVAGLVLFLVGLLFGFFIVYPISLAFFLAFETEGLRPAISISRHLSFFIGTTLSFGLTFQMPLVLLTLVRMGVLTATRLREMRKPALFFAFLAATLFTPSDVVSQFLMAIPLFLLYELVLLLAPRFESNETPAQESR